MCRVSVVMPLYNRAATVAAAVDSVLGQTFADFELIVVDDGSSDEGPAIVAGYADPRIRLIRFPENRGGNAARNAGVREARAPIVSFLDSDDEFLADKLRTVVDFFAGNPGFEGLIDSFRKVYPVTGKSARDRVNPELTEREDLLIALFHRRIWKATSGISVTRQAAVRAGLFDKSLKRRQDFDFLVRLIRVAKVASTAEVTWLKKESADAVSDDLDSYMGAFIDFWDRHPDYFNDPAFRGGFAADLSRHYSKLLIHGRLGRLGREMSLVGSRIGWPTLIGNVAAGAGELAQLKRERRRFRR